MEQGKMSSKDLAQPLLVDAGTAASMCGIGRTLWYDLRSAGRVPEPIRLGRRRLWRVDELQAWIAAGCPGQNRWEQMNKVK
jgi:predicted DNA-binding transcriptional regulator AlpA